MLLTQSDIVASATERKKVPSELFLHRLERIFYFSSVWPRGRGSIFLPPPKLRRYKRAICWGKCRAQPLDGVVIRIPQTTLPTGGTINWTSKYDVVCGLFLRPTLASRRRSHSPFVHVRAETSDVGSQAVKSNPSFPRHLLHAGLRIGYMQIWEDCPLAWDASIQSLYARRC